MSNILNLLKQKYPNGVDDIEKVTLEELLDYVQPTKYIVNSTVYNDEFDIPVLTAGKSFILGFTNEINGIYHASKEEPVIIFDDFTTSFHWVDFDFKVKSSALKILKPKNKSFNFKFVFYAMETINFVPGTHERQWIGNYSKFLIPKPDLEVQCEIVRILDNFAELTAELTAELSLRKSQAKYYKNFLILNPIYKRVLLKDIAIDSFRGSGISREEVSINGTPCIRYGEIYTKYNAYFTECFSHTNIEINKNSKIVRTNDLLFAITGESVADIAKTTAYLGNPDILCGGDIAVVRHNQNPKYLSFALSTDDAIKQKGKGKIKSKVVHTNVESILNIEIPLPELKNQEKIANYIDKFESVIYDMNFGLPREISLRKKQYAYYRDKLLSFNF